jgi:winged helix DNA-binding protein
MTQARLELSRAQILAFRRAVGFLDRRLPPGADSLRWAAWAGLQDSMPRAAVLSLHARVEGIEPQSWEDPSLAQIWGPRFSAYVVAAEDVPIFTRGRLPTDDARRRRAETTAAKLDAFLAGRRMTYGEAGRALRVNPNSLRYGAPTGRILIRWEGARQPIVWTVPPPVMDPPEARIELARRYLHVFGPSSAPGFGTWAGIRPSGAASAFEALSSSLTPIRTPIGDRWILSEDEAIATAPIGPAAGPRLLPSGDTFFLLQGGDRELLVPDARRRAALWTSRVWPGCLVLDGEPMGTWRRGDATLSIEPWRPLSPAERTAIEAEATSLPLPGVEGRVSVRWLE